MNAAAQPPRVVVVSPTYNERTNVPALVDALRELRIPGLALLVVDDNSPDGTGEVADKLATEHPGFVNVLHRPRKMGLGTAYLDGFRWALAQGASYIIEMDADLSHPPQTLHTFMELIQDYDVVVGSRYAKGSRLDERWGVIRRLLSWGGNVYARTLTGVPIADVTAGFKCFRREVLTSLDLDAVKSAGYAFQVELHYACHRKGFRLIEVPIYFQERTSGKSKMSMKIVLEAFWRVLEMRTRY